MCTEKGFFFNYLVDSYLTKEFSHYVYEQIIVFIFKYFELSLKILQPHFLASVVCNLHIKIRIKSEMQKY